MKAVLPVLDESRKEPYYLQLYEYLKQAILSGDIAPDEHLPSLRNLSKSTGLSMTTVERAYSQLLVEGYIYCRPRSGYFAGSVTGVTGTSVPSENTFSAPDLFSEPSEHAEAAPAMLYDPDCFDFNKWKKCMNRILTDYSPALFFEGSPQGELQLRQEICSYLYRSRGVSCRPEQIFIGAGTQQITGLLASVLRDLQIGHVALEDPGFAPVRNTFLDRGFAITDVRVAGDGMVLEKLPVNIRTCAYVTPSNHSPTGAVMPIGRRYELIRWAIANDSYIIEDDYDSELRYFGRPIPPLKSLTDDGRVIYLSSFSSTLFAAIRISYMVLPPQIAAAFTQRLSGYSQTCSKLEQLSLAMFMNTGWYQTHIRKLRKLYAQKLTLVTDTFRKEAADLVTVRNTASGMNILLRIRKTPAEDLQETLDRYIREAGALGIPAAQSSDRIIFYYNQIPLSDISRVLRTLIRRWRN